MIILKKYNNERRGNLEVDSFNLYFCKDSVI
jgi:hypothetical protein